MVLVSLDGLRTDFVRGLEHTVLPEEMKELGYSKKKIEVLNDFVTSEPEWARLFWLKVG